ncbi:glycine--tRNA ligase [Simkania sp.]|uniref:glycine--tRNA ligase n=1 Tax=Simkania sp. TaxID=34094 RepID=UPI003B517472
MLTFQQIITKLSTFWANHGCVIQQGHDLEVGAGTFNPATFLRSLGPEPFNTVYVEPSRRPQDGRFGKNPNRLQLFHQMQVIMKPSPVEIQQMYVESLEAIGFDLSNHDIRFVHDDWESPTLGAWGLGWEVWLDGMEVTQFTYFQSVAGYSLEPISVELTYGLERLCMVLQKKDNFFDMMWNETLTYGDIFHRNEVEWSHYNFNRASTEMWLRHFDDFEREAKTLAELHLPIPAYDFVMKASHAFNMLEARGVLSVTERMGYITRVRDLAKVAATEFLESREKLGFPLVQPPHAKKHEPHELSLPKAFDASHKEDFLLEIGSEELPAAFVPIGCQSLKQAIEKLLKVSDLSFDHIQVFGAPRRLSVLVKNLARGTKDTSTVRKGPPLSLAFDEKGNLTKQGSGFFQSIDSEEKPTLEKVKQGKVLGVSIQEVKGNDYLSCKVEKKGVSAAEILAKQLPKLIADLSFPKKMRWADLDLAYARPLHWIVALHGKEVVPFCIVGILSGNMSRGHRQLNPEPFSIPHASDYVEELKKHFVDVDIENRRASILKQLEAIESETNTVALEKEKVMKEVLYLSEWPQLFHASFDTKFLKVPEEVLTSEMIEHQRYFPLAETSGKLSNRFIITADNHPNETIRSGNEHVLTARLSDGEFLYKQDLETSLDEFAAKLNAIIFQKDLGTVAEKADRLKREAVILTQALELSSEKQVERAAGLAKADLATELVQEFPNLQGVIGKHYALHQNEDDEIALAIEEHWLPKAEGGPLPKTQTGTVVSLADKLDNLIGYFSVGLKPTSSSDPYALRRQTIGLIKILIENSLSLDLHGILTEMSSLFDFHDKKGLIQDLLEYITSRSKGVLEDYGFKKDEIEASLAGLCTDPYDQFLKTKSLHAFRQRPEFNQLYEVYKRAKGQLENQEAFTLQPDQLAEKAEVALHQAFREISPPFNAAMDKRDYEGAFSLLAKLQQPLGTLFDEVKILADDPKVRQNRLALLQEVFACFSLVMDFSKIQIL